jgi:hypothetical protein
MLIGRRFGLRHACSQLRADQGMAFAASSIGLAVTKVRSWQVIARWSKSDFIFVDRWGKIGAG